MYDEGCYYDTHDPNPFGEGGDVAGANSSGLTPLMSAISTGNSNNSLEENLRLASFSLEELSNHHHNTEAAAGMNFEEMNTHLMQDVLHDPDHISGMDMDQKGWSTGLHDMQGINSQQAQQFHHLNHDAAGQQIELQPNPFNASYAPTPTPDLLNLLHLPRCSVASMLPDSNIHLYDQSLHLNQLPPQQTPIFKELFHSLPHNYGLPCSRGGPSFFGGMDEREAGNGSVYQDGEGRQLFDNSVLDFSNMSGLGKRSEGKGTNHFATERQRREQLNDKYKSLRLLVPHPSKSDRASVVGDAIEYIKELLRTVEELKMLVDKKRYGRERKKLKTEDDAAGDMESSSIKPISTLADREQSNGAKRTTWLQRKSKDTEVDVRIIDDEVTIKLIQRKKINCLLSVSKILDELQLDLLHVSGGIIGDFYSFLFNSKIYENSSIYASAIAEKLIESVDKSYAAFHPGNF
ncbi:hypothetical protein IFM89_039040 [Coptis chinensis]|uniref:BHLH domain-containing protein n=1 Tax=Coptis chinensis TaxID=261450 RepID=A0A835IZR4_9MAGN|nr:hypothetical protein IFM89_039040 [Coptis chinensis]